MGEMYEGQFTVTECFQVPSTFQNNKAPGNDGLSAEFYKFFLARNRLLASRIHKLLLCSWGVIYLAERSYNNPRKEEKQR